MQNAPQHAYDDHFRQAFKHQLGESDFFMQSADAPPLTSTASYAPTILSLSQSYNPNNPSAWTPQSLPREEPVSYAQAPYGGPSLNGAPYNGGSFDQNTYNGTDYGSDYGTDYGPALSEQNNFQQSGYAVEQPHYAPQSFETANYWGTQNAPLAATQPVYVETGKSLNQSMDSALTQSPRLAIESIRIQEAEEGLVQAEAQGRFRLKLDGTLGTSQNETDFSVINRTDSAFRIPRAASLDLSLPLYEGGRIRAQKNAAKVGIDAARADYDAAETAVTQETAIAHLNVLRDRKLVDVYMRNVRLLQEQASVTRAMVSAGESTLTDEALLDARLGLVSVRLRQAEANLAASESNYKNLTAQNAPSLLDVGEIALPPSLAQVKEAASRNNALLLAGRTRAEAAEQNINIAKSFGRPKLALQGVLRAAEGQSDTIRRNSAAEILLNLSVPILSGGENRSRVRQAALAQSRAMLETRALQNDLNERIEQLWAQVEAAQLSIAPNLAQKAAGQKAYDAINKQRQAGVATLLDVLTVEQTLLDAEVNLVQSQNAEQTSRMELLGLMGAL